MKRNPLATFTAATPLAAPCLHTEWKIESAKAWKAQIESSEGAAI